MPVGIDVVVSRRGIVGSAGATRKGKDGWEQKEKGTKMRHAPS